MAQHRGVRPFAHSPNSFSKLWAFILQTPLVREAVARNPATSPRTLARLAKDSSLTVGTVARGVLGRSLLRGEESSSPALTWDEVIAPYGRAVEEVAWSVVCGGFDGSLEELVAAAVGAVA